MNKRMKQGKTAVCCLVREPEENVCSVSTSLGSGILTLANVGRIYCVSV